MIDFADAGTLKKIISVRENRGIEGNCQSSRSTKRHTCQAKEAAKEEDRRRANSHDVDKVDRWAAARWVPGGSTGVHQGSRRYVRSKEEAE